MHHDAALVCLPIRTDTLNAEYVWIGGTGQDMRSKTRTVYKKPTKPEDLPHWNYDGSSTGQAPGDDSEVYLIPRAIYRVSPA
jgi:glutamine synthetase